jgi:plasmid maintenance system antidote protein VapI
MTTSTLAPVHPGAVLQAEFLEPLGLEREVRVPAGRA